jgi:multicomponent Na+:H+ antiporter subunit D
MNGVVITGDLFNLFVFLEISVISSYALVAFGSSKDELEASFKYQVLGGIASLLILFALAITYWYTSTLNINDISLLLKQAPAGKITIFIQLFFIAGFGLKAALIPFHSWLPDAHSSAPSPISAMLSGILIKAIGVYALLRLFFNMFQLSLEISVIITTIGVLSMVIGVVLAIGQWDMKRLFAYHSISQMGYVVMAAGIAMIILSKGGDKGIAVLSLSGGLFHMFNHSVFKGLLFLNAGSVEYATGTRNLKELGGLSELLPVTSVTSLGASLSISGIPPFNGFFSKLIIIIAAIQGRFYLLAFLAVIVSIITLASFMKVQRYAFLDKLKKTRLQNIKEVPFLMCLPMIVLALLCLVMSLMVIPGIRETFLMPAVNSLISIIM